MGSWVPAMMPQGSYYLASQNSACILGFDIRCVLGCLIWLLGRLRVHATSLSSPANELPLGCRVSATRSLPAPCAAPLSRRDHTSQAEGAVGTWPRTWEQRKLNSCFASGMQYFGMTSPSCPDQWPCGGGGYGGYGTTGKMRAASSTVKAWKGFLDTSSPRLLHEFMFGTRCCCRALTSTSLLAHHSTPRQVVVR